MRRGLVAGAVLVFTSWMLGASGDGVSSGELYRGLRYSSPDGRHIAIFFGKAGGGAAGWAREYVTVVATASDFESSTPAFQMEHGYEVCLRWLSPTYLLIQYPDTALLVEARERVDGRDELTIRYEPVPSRDGLISDPNCAGRRGKLGGVDKEWD